MTLRCTLLVCSLMSFGLAAVPPALAQSDGGVIADVTSERTPTFTSSGTPGPMIDGRLLVGRPARAEGPFGLMGVDTPVGHVLVRRSAVMFAQPGTQPAKPACDPLSNLAPAGRNYGSNGLGEASGCPSGRR